MAVGYDTGTVAYDLDATESGPWFSVHCGPHSEGFYFAYEGTFAGTVKLQRRLNDGNIIDVDATSKTAVQGLTLVPFTGAGEFRFDFNRTSGTAECIATAPNGLLDWSSAIRLESLPGVLLLETSKPLSLE